MGVCLCVWVGHAMSVIIYLISCDCSGFVPESNSSHVWLAKVCLPWPRTVFRLENDTGIHCKGLAVTWVQGFLGGGRLGIPGGSLDFRMSPRGHS